MAKSLNLATLVTLAIAATLFQHSAATTFTVGDSYGWKTDSTGTVYKTWASTHTFAVGDVLVFNFTSGYHTVAKVIKESYENCDIDNPIELIQTGPASITLKETGEAYFICTVDQHCNYGQKLTINVKASTSSPPSSPPSIEPTSSSPPTSPTGGVVPPAAPPPSGATKTGLASIFTIFISAAVCLLF